jgi:hypothetical protein
LGQKITATQNPPRTSFRELSKVAYNPDKHKQHHDFDTKSEHPRNRCPSICIKI